MFYQDLRRFHVPPSEKDLKQLLEGTTSSDGFLPSGNPGFVAGKQFVPIENKAIKVS